VKTEKENLLEEREAEKVKLESQEKEKRTIVSGLQKNSVVCKVKYQRKDVKPIS
jgi:hypothetical protein